MSLSTPPPTSRSLNRLPTISTLVAIAAFAIICIGTLMVASWMTALGEQWARQQAESTMRRASALVAMEFDHRREFVESWISDWSGDSFSRRDDPERFFAPMFDDTRLFDVAFIVDARSRELSAGVHPLIERPLAPDLYALGLELLEGPAGEALERIDARAVWAAPPDLAQPDAWLLARMDANRVLVARFSMVEALSPLMHALHAGDMALSLRRGSIELLAAGALPDDVAAGRTVEDVITVGGTRGAVLRLSATSVSVDDGLLSTIRQLLIAGGLMFALTVASLILGWSRTTEQTERTRQRARLLHDRSPLFYQELDEDLYIRNVNQTQCEALGYTYEDLVDTPIERVVVDSPQLLEDLNRPAGVAASFRTHAVYRTRSGDRREVHVTVLPEQDELGRLRWVMLAQDVTETVAAQRASARSQVQVRFLSKVVDSLDDGLLILDQDGHVIYSNPAANRLADPEGRGMIGRTLPEIFASPPRSDMMGTLVAAARAGEPWQAELGLASDPRDDVRLLVRLSGESHRESGGVAYLLLLRDLTAERKLSRELAVSQRQFETIFDQAPTGILVLDSDGRPSTSNDFYRKHIAPLVEGGDGRLLLNEMATFREALVRLFAGNELTLDSFAISKPGVGRRVFAIKGVPEIDGQGRTRRALLFVDDITERFEAQRQTAERARSLEGERERALEASRLKSRFLATITHELRTPLNAIIGFSQIVARKSGPMLEPRQRENLEKIEESGQRLLRLVNDLLDISKIEAGHVEIHLESVKLETFFEELRRQVEPLMEKNNNVLTFELKPGIGMLETDPLRLQQIMLNLVGNAAKFTHNGKVTVTAEWEDDLTGSRWLVVRVADTGVGIEPGRLNEIFEEFYQVDSGVTRRYEGTGLGLAITRRLVERMHGRISVTSIPGSGSTFTVRLPRRLSDFNREEFSATPMPDSPETWIKPIDRALNE